MTKTAKLKKFKRQLGKNWLPFNLFYIDRRGNTFSRLTTRKIKLTGKTTLLVHFRSFRVKNKPYSIRIPKIYTSNLRQIDFKLKTLHKRGRKPVKKPRVSFFRNKLILGRLLMIVGILGLGASLFFLQGSSTSSLPIPEDTPASIVTTQQPEETNQETFLPRSKPVKIVIDSIGVSAPVIGVGKLKDKTMETPYSRTNTGWYKYSPTPGEKGPSVIVGHVDWIDGPAVFYNLKSVKKGAKIVVTRKDGKKAVFKTYKTEQYSQNKFPTKKVYGNTDESELRLITCSGEFDRTTYTYNKNIVVYARLVT